ncbi:DUF448 domain-containing protein [Altererythrobacter arenosus]|uniref:DUF448 domain-containing protein n=1 Tax=Altererythrobacter arenosus TaxID=3032592 RepID=A0ABY8FUB5_9SPHN|nr:DUF448 domain-containing protein [Altererythrobacter sp. CAU 1644]WFL77830.1 DUF448 domain-containing protein [Altererythrobacter sp. CAU 1644]
MRTPPNERLTSDIAGRPKARNASEPERRCILSGEHGSRDSLVRLAISPEGLVLPDPAAKAPGRGAWIGVTRAELEAATAKGHLKGALARAFKGASLSIPEDLADLVEQALERSLRDRLGLELRAGKLVLGSDRIAEQARMGRIAMLLHAADASEDGRKKLDQAWRVGRDAEGSGERGRVLPLDRAALSVALGRENVVHLALADAAAAERVEQALARLLHYIEGEKPVETEGSVPMAQRQDDELNA